jgi:hypothetical protein
MRKVSLLLFAALTLGGVGCGKSTPPGPPNLTPEQIETGNREQKKVEGEERAHQRTDPGNEKRSGNSVDEERRARGNR